MGNLKNVFPLRSKCRKGGAERLTNHQFDVIVEVFAKIAEACNTGREAAEEIRGMIRKKENAPAKSRSER